MVTAAPGFILGFSSTSSMLRRHILSLTALACVLGTATVHAQSTAPATAGTYPTKPIRMIVPFPPGGGTDILARLVSAKLTEANKWTVVADNKPGAGGTIGITEAVKAIPFKVFPPQPV